MLRTRRSTREHPFVVEEFEEVRQGRPETPRATYRVRRRRVENTTPDDQVGALFYLVARPPRRKHSGRTRPNKYYASGVKLLTHRKQSGSP